MTALCLRGISGRRYRHLDRPGRLGDRA